MRVAASLASRTRRLDAEAVEPGRGARPGTVRGALAAGVVPPPTSITRVAEAALGTASASAPISITGANLPIILPRVQPIAGEYCQKHKKVR